MGMRRLFSIGCTPIDLRDFFALTVRQAERTKSMSISKDTFPIPPESTFNTLLAHLQSLAGASGENNPCVTLKKPDKRPTAKYLRENVTTIASSFNCTAYANGYAVYATDAATTVIWIPDCLSYSYQFARLEKNELEYLSDHMDLTAEFLGNLPWHLAVALRGEDQAERRLLHRKGDRKETKSLVWNDKEVSGAEANPDREPRVITTGNCYENPEDVLIRKETVREYLNTLTEKQKKCFLLRYHEGFTLQEIAEKQEISAVAVNCHLSAAMEKAEKFVTALLENEKKIC